MDIIDVMDLIENFGLLGKDFIFLESKEEQKDFDLMCVKLLEIKYQEVEDGIHTIDEYTINKFFNKYGSIDLTEIENHFCKFSHLEVNIYIDKFYKKELEKRKIELIQKLKKLEIEYTLIDGEIIMSNEVLKVIAKKFSKVKRDLFLTDEENKILRLKNTDFKKIELQINYIY